MSDYIFVLYPGFIASRSDEDIHYITYLQLINLYKLDRRKCINAKVIRGIPKEKKGYIHLKPRFFGDYIEHLNTKIKEQID